MVTAKRICPGVMVQTRLATINTANREIAARNRKSPIQAVPPPEEVNPS
jgi:hypothetical protein